MTADQVAYTRVQAAEKCGYSRDVIDAAVRAGDLREVKPEINGRRLKRGRILHEDLVAWMRETAS